ncbi:MAG: pyridoxamine 5'-phosphate oxidase family protein [Vicinamibacterales bacterium]
MSQPEVSGREKALELLRSFETAMMVTHAPSGPLDCRPMHVAQVEPDGSVMFFASAESHVTLHVRKDARVLLVMQDAHDRYVSLFGRASVLADRERVEGLWREDYRRWFPEGVDPRDLVLLVVNPDYAEYWDRSGMDKLRYLFDKAPTNAEGLEAGAQHGRVKL